MKRVHVAKRASDLLVELFADACPIILMIEVCFFSPVILRLFLVDGNFNFLATESVGLDGFFILGGDGIGELTDH